MKFSTVLQLCALPLLTLAQHDHSGHGSAAPATTTDTRPMSYGVLLYPGFEALDVFGPLDLLNLLSATYTNMTISLIAANSSEPVTTAHHAMGQTFGESVVPTHNFTSHPSLDVLIVPGGMGARDNRTAEIHWLRETIPSVQYLIPVCTGNGLVAQAGALHQRRATGNKRSWEWITKQSNTTHWVANARWVVSDEATPKIWSTSGVSAGVDGTLHWISTVFGEPVADSLTKSLEWTQVTDPAQDEFALLYQLKDVTYEGSPYPVSEPFVAASSSSRVTFGAASLMMTLFFTISVLML